MDKNIRRKQLYQDTLLRWCNTKLSRRTLESIHHLARDSAAILAELIDKLSVKQDLEKGDDRLLHLLADLLLHYDVVCPLRPQYDDTSPRDARYLFLTWINRTLPHHYTVSNFTQDWRDGRALGALLNGIAHEMCPGWWQWDTENCVVNITQAMDTAHSHLIGIDKLLGPTDMCYANIMDINIIAYLSQLLGARMGRTHGYRKVLQSPVELTETVTFEREQQMQEPDEVVATAVEEPPAPPVKHPSNISRANVPKTRRLPPIPPGQSEERSVNDHILDGSATSRVSVQSLKYLNLEISGAKNRSEMAAETIPKTPYPGGTQNQYTTDPVPSTTYQVEDSVPQYPHEMYDETLPVGKVKPYDSIHFKRVVTGAAQTVMIEPLDKATQTDTGTKSVKIQVGRYVEQQSQGSHCSRDGLRPGRSISECSLATADRSGLVRQECVSSDYLLQSDVDTETTDSGITNTHSSSMNTDISENVPSPVSSDVNSEFSQQCEPDHGQSLIHKFLPKLPHAVQNTMERVLETEVDTFVPGRVVYEDSMGVYHRSRYKKAGQTQIVLSKSIPGELTERGVSRLAEEAHTRTMFNHINILELVKMLLVQGQLYVLLPRVDRGTLKEYLVNSAQDLKTPDRLVIGLDVARAMDHVTSLDYVVQNLDTLTCMVTSERVVKLTDLSAVRDIINGSSITYTGDINAKYRWLAPEVLTTKQYGIAADIWMWGVLLWSVFNNGMEPYSDMEMNSVVYNVAKGERPPENKNMSPEIYKLLMACWVEEPTVRIQFTDMCELIKSLLLDDDGYRQFYTTYIRATKVERNQSYCQIPGDGPKEVIPALPPREPIYLKTKPKNTVTVDEYQQNIAQHVSGSGQRRPRGYTNVTLDPFCDTTNDERILKTASW